MIGIELIAIALTTIGFLTMSAADGHHSVGIRHD